MGTILSCLLLLLLLLLRLWNKTNFTLGWRFGFGFECGTSIRPDRSSSGMWNIHRIVISEHFTWKCSMPIAIYKLWAIKEVATGLHHHSYSSSSLQSMRFPSCKSANSQSMPFDLLIIVASAHFNRCKTNRNVLPKKALQQYLCVSWENSSQCTTLRIHNAIAHMSQTATTAISKTMTGNSLAVHDQTWASLSAAHSTMSAISLAFSFSIFLFFLSEQIFDKFARRWERLEQLWRCVRATNRYLNAKLYRHIYVCICVCVYINITYIYIFLDTRLHYAFKLHLSWLQKFCHPLALDM